MTTTGLFITKVNEKHLFDVWNALLIVKNIEMLNKLSKS